MSDIECLAEQRSYYTADVVPLLVEYLQTAGLTGDQFFLGVRAIDAVLVNRKYFEIRDLNGMGIVQAGLQSGVPILQRTALGLLLSAQPEDVSDGVIREVFRMAMQSDDLGVRSASQAFFSEKEPPCLRATTYLRALTALPLDDDYDSMLLVILNLARTDSATFTILASRFLPTLFAHVSDSGDELRQSSMLEVVGKCSRHSSGAVYIGQHFGEMSDMIRSTPSLVPSAAMIFSNISLIAPDIFIHMDREHEIINSILIPQIEVTSAARMSAAHIAIQCPAYINDAYPTLLQTHLLPPPYAQPDRLKSLAILVRVPTKPPFITLDMMAHIEEIARDPARPMEAIQVLFRMTENVWGVECIVQRASLLTFLLDRSGFDSWPQRTARWTVLQRMVDTDASIGADEGREAKGLGYLRSMIITEAAAGPAGSGQYAMDVAAQNA